MSYSFELAEWLNQLTPAELVFWETKSQFAKARFFATIPSGKRLKALRAEINEQKRIDSMSVDERDQEHEQWLKQLTTAELSAWEKKSQSEKNWLFAKTPPDMRLKVLRAEINVREWLDSMSTEERERVREQGKLHIEEGMRELESAMLRLSNEALELAQLKLSKRGLSSHIACYLRSDVNFLAVIGRDRTSNRRIEIEFHWRDDYWRYHQNGSYHRMEGDVSDLIKFMDSMDWIPPKKGQLELWDF